MSSEDGPPDAPSRLPSTKLRSPPGYEESGSPYDRDGFMRSPIDPVAALDFEGVSDGAHGENSDFPHGSNTSSRLASLKKPSPARSGHRFVASRMSSATLEDVNMDQAVHVLFGTDNLQATDPHLHSFFKDKVFSTLTLAAKMVSLNEDFKRAVSEFQKGIN